MTFVLFPQASQPIMNSGISENRDVLVRNARVESLGARRAVDKGGGVGKSIWAEQMAVEPEAKKSRVELRYGVFTFCL